MLTSIRASFEKGLPKYILIGMMSLLVLSFAVWGIGDLVRTGGRSTTALKIGSVEISAQDLQREFQREQRSFARELGRNPTPQESAAYRLDERVLSRLTTETLLDEEAKTLKLSLSEAGVAERIRNSEAFKNSAGAFNRVLFQQTINELGYNEADFAQQEARFALRQHIAKGVMGAIKTPEIMLEALNKYQNEKRSATYYVIGAAQIEAPKPLTPEGLENYYKANILKFSAPELRKVTLIDASFEALESQVKVNDAEIQAYYDEVKTRLVPEEKRELQRLKFTTLDAANEALKSGKSFETLAQEANVKPEELNFGTFTKAEIIDAEIAKAAFALKEGEVSQPLTTSFGTFLVRVAKINASTPPSLASILAPLKAELTRRKLRDITEDLRVKIDKETASGLPLGEVAKKLNLATKTIEGISNKGLDLNGTDLKIAGGVETLKNIFESGVNADNLAIALKDNTGYVWYEVNAIIPPRVRPLSEVKTLAESLALEEAVKNAIKTKAETLSKSPVTLEEQAKGLKLEAKTSGLLTRISAEIPFGSQALTSLFSAQMGETNITPAQDGVDYIVFKLKETLTTARNSDSAEFKNFDRQLAQSYENDILSQYVMGLQRKMPVKRNEANIKAGFGKNAIEP